MSLVSSERDQGGTTRFLLGTLLYSGGAHPWPYDMTWLAFVGPAVGIGYFVWRLTRGGQPSREFWNAVFIAMSILILTNFASRLTNPS